MERIIFKTENDQNGGAEYLALTKSGLYSGNTAATAGRYYGASVVATVKVKNRKALNELRAGLVALGFTDGGRV